MKKNKKESPFKVIKMSFLEDEKGHKFEIGENVVIYLKNGEYVEGKILNATSKTITLQTSSYEYTETGAEYSCKFLMLSNVHEISSTGCTTASIDWEEYSMAINKDERRY